MPRQCQCCQSEFLQILNQRLRQGDSKAALAAELGLSEDAVRRHAARHLGTPKPNATTEAKASSLYAKWEKIYNATEELLKTANVQGDLRASLQALQQQASALEASERARESTRESGSFESLSIEQKVELIRENKALCVALYDDVLKATEVAIREHLARGYRFNSRTGMLELPDPEKPGQPTDSASQVN